ncbi:MAG: hypothetical protein LBL17_05110 [Coxiellaceae bacterium]|jgi:hypothetical protein|nr:hypothetical protein [Coxiellaceae bacterium]
MNQVLIKYQKIIDNLPLVTRAVISATMLGTFFVVWYYSFWQSLYHSLVTTSKKVQTLKLSIPTLETQLKTLENEVKAKLKLEAKDTANDTSLHSKTKTMLYDLSKTTNNLILLQLQNLPPKEIVLPTAANTKVTGNGIIIKFSSDYLSTMHYLQEIEKLPWRIFWDKLEYKVIQYPTAEITLYIHTIDRYGDWINV